MLPKPVAVCFVTGQPVGYYSSCLGLFHTITSYGSVVGSRAALSRSPVSGLCLLAVLGDDILLSRVASEYASVLADLGLTIYHQKVFDL